MRRNIHKEYTRLIPPQHCSALEKDDFLITDMFFPPTFLHDTTSLGTFKLSLLYEEHALEARTDGEIEKSITLYGKAGKYAWEGARVFGLLNDRDMEAIVRGRAEGIDR